MESNMSVKKEAGILALAVLSFPPLFILGSLLDILLVHQYAACEEMGFALPYLSQWVFRYLAGYRFIPHQMMFCFWLLMIVAWLGFYFSSNDSMLFRSRFVISWLIIWLVALTVSGFIIMAVLLPYDLLLIRFPDRGTYTGFEILIMAAIVFEALLILFIPVYFMTRRKRRGD